MQSGSKIYAEIGLLEASYLFEFALVIHVPPFKQIDLSKHGSCLRRVERICEIIGFM